MHWTFPLNQRSHFHSFDSCRSFFVNGLACLYLIFTPFVASLGGESVDFISTG